MTKLKSAVRNTVTKAKTNLMLINAGVMPERSEGSHTMEVLGFLVIAAILVVAAKKFFYDSMWTPNAEKAGKMVSDLFTTKTE